MYRAPWPWTNPLWTWDLTVQGPLSPTPWTGPCTAVPPAVGPHFAGTPYRLVVTFGGQDRIPVQTCLLEETPLPPCF